MSEENRSVLDQFPESDEEFEQQKEVLEFEEYLEKVIADSRLARSSFQRVYDMIVRDGSEPSGKIGAEDVPRYKFFDDHLTDGERAIYGIEETIDEVMTFLRAGAKAQDARKRLLVLNGPVGTAKSTMMSLIKSALEQYTRTSDGALYTLEWHSLESSDIERESGFIEDYHECPIREDPLKLLPIHAIDGHNVRQQFLNDLNDSKKPIDKIHLPGGLCPLCQFQFDKLLKSDEYQGDWKRVLRDHVRVKRVLFSESAKRGIGTFAPKDEKNQDSTELTGDTHLTKLGIYGFETDPRVFAYNGEFMVGNRGLVEFIEVLKLQVEFLYDLLHATAENQVKGKGMPFMWIDTLLVAHTNIPEYKRLIDNERMEAFRDRMDVVKVPYVTELSEEERVYAKLEQSGKFERHFSPHVLKVASTLSVLSRLDIPPDGNILAKAKAYDGKTVSEYGPEKVPEMREKAEEDGGEGMTGISPRQLQNIFMEIDNASRYEDCCITPYAFLDEARKFILNNEEYNREKKDRYLTFVEFVKDDFNEIAKDDIIRALSSDVKELQNLCDVYIANAKASLEEDGKVVNNRSGERVPPDEEMMASIETRIGMDTPEKSRKFRTQLTVFMVNNLQKGETFQYDTHDGLYKALRAELFEKMKGTIDLGRYSDSDLTDKMKDSRQLLVGELKNIGYCDCCADDLIKHGAGLFNKDSN